MEKSEWLDFVASRLKTQISLEAARKAETWALALVGLAALGEAIAILSGAPGERFLASAKVLFLVLFYACLVFGVHFVGFLQRGEKPAARVLGIQDFTSLTAAALAVTFYSFVILSVSHQGVVNAADFGASGFFLFTLWLNDLLALLQSLAAVFFLVSLLFFPRLIRKFGGHGGKVRPVLFGVHLALGLLLAIGYSEWVTIGSSVFFEGLRLTGLFWIFIVVSLLWLGRVLQPSAVPALAALERDVAADRLEHSEDILERFKTAFLSRRLLVWMAGLSRTLAAETERVARFSHEAIHLTDRERPSEIDLNLVEERCRKAEAAQKRLERLEGRFLVSLSLFDLNEPARAKGEELRDQFSRELRTTKLEIVSVRKRIDEKLVSLKPRELPSKPEPPVEAAEGVGLSSGN